MASAATPVPQSAQFSFVDTDGGTCGNSWALDLGSRQFSQPKADPAGNYALVEKFIDGHFSTAVGQSPGACNTGADSGRKVVEGLHGSWSGNEHVFVTSNGGTFDVKDGSCNGFPTSDMSNPCTNASYVAYHYGAAATYTITTYAFAYHTSDKRAIGKAWTEKSSGSTEIDTGDIYTSTSV